MSNAAGSVISHPIRNFLVAFAVGSLSLLRVPDSPPVLPPPRLAIVSIVGLSAASWTPRSWSLNSRMGLKRAASSLASTFIYHTSLCGHQYY
jgi:hypothetical protein